MSTSQPLDLSTVGFKAKRFATLQELRTQFLRDDVPQEEAKKLWDYVVKYDLEFTMEDQDCGLFSTTDAKGGKSFWINTSWSGIQRICMSSGLWMPGKSEIRVVNGDMVAFASCYVRRNTTSEQWLEVTAFAKYGSYYERDFFNEDKERRKDPTGDWAVVPERLLDEVAQYNAAVKGLGRIVTEHRYQYANPVVVFYDQKRKNDAANGRAGAQAKTPG